MAEKANYVIIRDDDEALVITDVGPWNRHLTITNDAERVVEELRTNLKGRRLQYYDSEGELGELRVVDGKFAGFA